MTRILRETYVNLLNDDLEGKKRYLPDVERIIELSYAKIGGPANITSYDQLLDRKYFWKLNKKDGKVVAVCIYKTSAGGRKISLCGSDGTPEGKARLYALLDEDVHQVARNTWGEFSGAMEHIYKDKLGATPIPNEVAKRILNDLGKDVVSLNPDGFHYTRSIKGRKEEKIMLGNIPEDLSLGSMFGKRNESLAEGYSQINHMPDHPEFWSIMPALCDDPDLRTALFDMSHAMDVRDFDLGELSNACKEYKEVFGKRESKEIPWPDGTAELVKLSKRITRICKDLLQEMQDKLGNDKDAKFTITDDIFSTLASRIAKSIDLDSLLEEASIVPESDFDFNGPAFIMPDGRVINVDTNLDGTGYKNMHSELAYALFKNILTQRYPNATIATYGTVDHDLLILLTNHYGLARVNFGNTAMENRFYCVLPPRGKNPSQAMYGKLIEFIDWGYNNKERYFNVFFGSGSGSEHVEYNLLQYTTDELIFNFKRGYATGRFMEGVSKGQEEFFRQSVIRGKDGSLIPMWHGSSESFKEFKNPINWFTTSKSYASEFASWLGGEQHYYQAYLNCKRPLNLGSTDEPIYSPLPIKPYKLSSASLSLAKRIGITADELLDLVELENEQAPSERDPDGFRKKLHVITRMPEFAKIAKEHGFDSLIALEAGHLCVGVLNPNDIKEIGNENPTSGNRIDEYLETVGVDDPSQYPVYATDEPYKLASLLKRGDKPYRIFHDDSIGVYFFQDARGDLVHVDMVNKALRQGWMAKSDYRYMDDPGDITSGEFYSDYACDNVYFVFTPLDFSLANNNLRNWYVYSIGEDGYYNCRVYPFGVLWVRDQDAYDSGLANALGTPDKEIEYTLNAGGRGVASIRMHGDKYTISVPQEDLMRETPNIIAFEPSGTRHWYDFSLSAREKAKMHQKNEDLQGFGKTFKFPNTSTMQRALKSLEDKGYKLETVAIKRLVSDNNLLDNSNLNYHTRLWGPDPDDYRLDQDEVGDWMFSDIMSCVNRNGKYELENGRHRTRALFNSGYDSIEIPVLEESLNESKQDQERFKDWLAKGYKDATLASKEYDSFMRMKNSFGTPYSDIYYWMKRPFDEFKSFLSGRKTKSQSNADAERLAKEGARQLYSDANWKVYEITNYEASAKYGKGTKWCITASKHWGNNWTGESKFKEYKDQGVRFFFFISRDSKYCLALYPDNKSFEIYGPEDVQLPYIPNAPKIDSIPVDYTTKEDWRVLYNSFIGGRIPFSIARDALESGLWYFNEMDECQIDDINDLLTLLDCNIPDDYLEYANEHPDGMWDGDVPCLSQTAVDEIDLYKYASKKDLLKADNFKDYMYFIAIEDDGEMDLQLCKDWASLLLAAKGMCKFNNWDATSIEDHLSECGVSNVDALCYESIRYIMEQLKRGKLTLSQLGLGKNDLEDFK